MEETPGEEEVAEEEVAEETPKSVPHNLTIC